MGSVTASDLRQARLDAGMTQAAVAALLGTTQSSVARWERGDVEPSLGNTVRLAHAVGRRLTLAPPDRTTFGASMRRARVASGLSQVDLARALELAVGTVSRWERGAASPPPDVVARALVRAARSTPAIDDTLTADQRGRLEANLRLTPAERLERSVRAARFVLAGRQALAATRHDA